MVMPTTMTIRNHSSRRVCLCIARPPANGAAYNNQRFASIFEAEVGPTFLGHGANAAYRLCRSSLVNADRNSSSARLPAYSAAAWDWNPLRPTITPIGLL